jgi:hypothetical protein
MSFMGVGMNRIIGAASVLFLTACVPAGQNNQAEYNASVISEAEIDASGGTTAYEVIKKVRANFLSYRGETTIHMSSPTSPMVFVDGQLFGDINALKQLMAPQIAEIRLYRSWEATTKFGTGYMAGVIAVTSRH